MVESLRILMEEIIQGYFMKDSLSLAVYSIAMYSFWLLWDGQISLAMPFCQDASAFATDLKEWNKLCMLET